MSIGWMIFGGILLVILAAALAGVLYLTCSPMFVVKKMRAIKEILVNPPGYEEEEKKVEAIKDLEYPSRYRQNTWDLYLPKEECSRPLPLILWVHGGGFVGGDKYGISNICVLLAAKGYAVAAMNYAWAPESSYPVQIRQVAEVLGEISKQSRIDMRRVVVAGDSAGAYLALQFALCHTNPVLAERLEVRSPLDRNALKGALLYCGPYDISKLADVKDRMLRFVISRVGWSFLGQKNWRKSPLIDTVTPMDYVTKDSVPCYITDGNTLSFEEHGRALGEALRRQGVFVRERYFDQTKGKVGHGYEAALDTEQGLLCLKDTYEMLEIFFSERG